MATILIVEKDAKMRLKLEGLSTPHELICVASAQDAWSLVEAGVTFDEVIHFADPVAEALLRAAGTGLEDEHELDLAA